MPDAAYYRAWRAAHPEYRRRQSKLRNERRLLHGREDRSREYARRVPPSAPPEPIPPVWVAGQHPLIDLAWGYVKRCPKGVVVSFREDELVIDAIGVAVLAMLERRDPAEAVRAFYAVESNWIGHLAPLLKDGLGNP
jgi:hypothetical protein